MSNQKGHIDPLETSLIYGYFSDIVDEKARDYVMWINSFGRNNRKYFENLGSSPTCPVPSIFEKPLVLEEKALPSHLRYAYLGASSTLPVIISSYLS